MSRTELSFAEYFEITNRQLSQIRVKMVELVKQGTC